MDTLHSVLPVVLTPLVGAVVTILAFPPFGPGFLVIPGITLFLISIYLSDGRRQGLIVGIIYGTVFFGGFLWWLSELELIALILVPVQAAFLILYAWWLARYRDVSPGRWVLLAVGGWALMELVRYYFPVGGFEWGAAGYALSDLFVTRIPAAVVGTSGLTVLVVMVCAVLGCVFTGRFQPRLLWSLAVLIVVVLVTVPTVVFHADGGETRVAIVQGSTPCPFEHCPPDERLRTFQQHLALTETIEAGSVDLVVWAEGSTGSTNADPVLNEEIADAIGAQARRIGAPMLVGGDRVINDTEWVNANVYFNAAGEIVGEYRKRHPVPFGEFVPWRPVFAWIPALDRVPRDMVPGDGPVVFEDGLGSVISFEGGFSRYALDTRRIGATAIVVATNTASYGLTPASDVWLGMTRMRAVELGVPIIHAAVTGKSTMFSPRGNNDGTTGLGTQEIFYGTFSASQATPFATIGNSVMYLAALLGLVVWWTSRSLVVSGDATTEEE